MIRHRAETLVANYFFPKGLLSLFYAVVIAEVVAIVAVLPDIPYQLTAPFLLLTLAPIAFVSSRLVRRYRTFRSLESQSSDHELFQETGERRCK